MADTTYKIPHDTLKKEISKPEDFTPPEELYKKLIATIRAYRPTTDLSEIEKAYKIASKAHEGQKRKSGEPYIICLLYTSPSPRDPKTSRMPSSA